MNDNSFLIDQTSFELRELLCEYLSRRYQLDNSHKLLEKVPSNLFLSGVDSQARLFIVQDICHELVKEQQQRKASSNVPTENIDNGARFPNVDPNPIDSFLRHLHLCLSLTSTVAQRISSPFVATPQSQAHHSSIIRNNPLVYGEHVERECTPSRVVFEQTLDYSLSKPHPTEPEC